jgi:hypothetical protein
MQPFRGDYLIAWEHEGGHLMLDGTPVRMHEAKRLLEWLRQFVDKKEKANGAHKE